MVVVAVTVDRATGAIVAGPEIVSRGWVYESEAEAVLEEARAAVRDALAERGPRRRSSARRSVALLRGRSAASSTSASSGSRSCCPWSWRSDGEGEGPVRAKPQARRPVAPARPRASSPSGSPAYLGVALLSYDPALRWVDQGARVGVVGLWLGWALFTTVGYAGYLVPVC